MIKVIIIKQKLHFKNNTSINGIRYFRKQNIWEPVSGTTYGSGACEILTNWSVAHLNTKRGQSSHLTYATSFSHRCVVFNFKAPAFQAEPI